jgi:hypothetical protein
LLRSLNYYSGYSEGNEYPRFYDVLDITYLTPDRAKVIQKKIASGEITCLILHLAEGRRGDGESQYEFTVLQNYGLLTNKTALIHAAALNRASIQLMAQNGASLVWSPRSNLTLYGQTADIRAAVKDGVLIALAPDWSITGSDNVLDELKVARLFFDDDTNDNGLNRDLVRMVTSNPAAIAGLSGEIGSLKPGYAADLVAVRGDAARPYGSLIDASVQNVELVMIDGQPYYGSPEIMRMLGQGTDSETINVCGEPKLLHLRDSNPPPGGLEVTLTELTRRLTAAIGQLPSPRPSLAPMFSCR